MTAKEKAKELVNKYIRIAYYRLFFGDEVSHHAKECALMTVNEIINSNPYECDEIEILHSNIPYWQEVKKEIELYYDNKL